MSADLERAKEIANAIPDDIDLYRIIRAAGQKDWEKAKAVRAVLEPIEAAVRRILEEQKDGN